MFDQRRHICLSQLLFKQHQISFPVTKLTAVCDIIRTEQDTDIAVEFGFSASTDAPWAAGDTVCWQIPSQIITHACARVDVAIDRFLTDPQWRLFVDHPVANLLGRPAVLDTFDYTFAQFRV